MLGLYAPPAFSVGGLRSHLREAAGAARPDLAANYAAATARGVHAKANTRIQVEEEEKSKRSRRELLCGTFFAVPLRPPARS